MQSKTKKTVRKAPIVKRTRTRARTGIGGKKASLEITSEDLNRRIEAKAFDLFERRGYQHGWHDYDWSMAENLVNLEVNGGKKRRFKAVAPDVVQRKAYEIFVGHGPANGAEIVDWHLAEEFARYDSK